ncbi:uncharacterized protein LOC116619339 isoform X3 [Nematostella vectensis]|uniref:uncharacterized protein LOC116619339 isoform X3 n=1 Tax=Nematostella vectensis TaxID=45351 RepID=UPI002076F80D|nr:uncharacterized protein LOC116619339 isoform X3 [Nematostella vectensis]
MQALNSQRSFYMESSEIIVGTWNSSSTQFKRVLRKIYFPEQIVRRYHGSTTSICHPSFPGWPFHTHQESLLHEIISKTPSAKQAGFCSEDIQVE